MLEISYNKEENLIYYNKDCLYRILDNYGNLIFQSIKIIGNEKHITLEENFNDYNSMLDYPTNGDFTNYISFKMDNSWVGKTIQFKIKNYSNKCGFLVNKYGSTKLIGQGFGIFESDSIKEYTIPEDIEKIYFMSVGSGSVIFNDKSSSFFTPSKSFYELNGYDKNGKLLETSNSLFTTENKIIFYNNISEDNKLSKTLINSKEYNITFKDNVSITNPVIIINSAYPITFNYCFLPLLNRYYFIDDIVSLNNNLWEIHLIVDVLMSYNSEIRDLDCKVLRQEYNYNVNLYDDKLEFNTKPKIYKIEFDSELELDFNDPTFIVTCANNTFSSPEISQPLYKSPSSGFTGTYFLRKEYAWQLSGKLWTRNIIDAITNMVTQPADAILSINYLPIKYDRLRMWLNYASQLIARDYLKVGGAQIDFEDMSTWGNIYEYAPNGRAYQTKIGEIEIDLRDYGIEEYLFLQKNIDLSVYIPFVGLVPLDNDKFFINGKGNIKIYYLFDFFRCKTIANIKYNDNLMEYHDCDIFYSVPITSGGLSNIVRNVASTALSIATAYQYGLVNKNVVAGQTQIQFLRTQSLANAGSPTMNSYKFNTYKTVKGFSMQSAIQKNPNIINTVGNSVLGVSMNTQHCGTFNGNSWIMKNSDDVSKPYVLMTIPDIIPINNYNYLVGKPSSYSGKLSFLNGFTQVGSVHIKNFNNATIEERNMIEDLLKSGIIL